LDHNGRCRACVVNWTAEMKNLSPSEIVGAAVLAMQLEATLEDLQRAILPHPTLSEALIEAAQRAR